MDKLWEARFWSKVNVHHPQRCWEYRGTKDSGGYGRFKLKGELHAAHRIAFEIWSGKRPTQDVLHSCDNPACCNPSHLREGNDGENVYDSIRRGRWWYKRTLNPIAVAVIRQLAKEGRTTKDIARAYGMSEGNTGKVVARKAWAWVPERLTEVA